MAMAAQRLIHPALGPPAGVALAGAREAGLADRARLGVVLQGAALLAHLAEAGWVLVEGWRGAAVDAEGRLTGCRVEPGEPRLLPQEYLVALVDALFGGGGVAGRGSARRALRDLLPAWRQALVAIDPGEAVVALLRAAPELAEPWAAEARRSLVAEVERTDRRPRELLLAVPRALRRRLLAGSPSREAVEAELASGRLGELVVAEAVAPRGERRPRLPAADEGDGLAKARSAIAAGRFLLAQDALGSLSPSFEVRVERLLVHQHLGELAAARALLRGLGEELDRAAGRQLVALAPHALLASGSALRVLANSNETAAIAPWLERLARAVEAVDAADLREGAGQSSGGAETLRAQAELLAALAAWDRGDAAAMTPFLDAARRHRDHPEVGWRWHNARSLQAFALDDASAAVTHAEEALRLTLRRQPRWRVARLWNELAIVRAVAGDTAGAERAAAHAARELAACDGPALLTLALPNLAEIRIRRGRLQGVEEILARTLFENERAGNRRALGRDRELAIRHDLLCGRLAAVLTRCRELLAAPDHGDADPRMLRLLAARALGWLGRTGEALAMLGAGGGEVVDQLEPEERPAVWALAGDTAEAWREAERVVHGGLWTAVLAGRRAAPAAWDALEGLEPYRAARVVLDVELVSPGLVPPRWLRLAVVTLRKVGAEDLAARLEATSVDPWTAVAGYLGRGRREGEEIARLFAACGQAEVRLWWEDERRVEVLVDGAGGGEELEAPLAGGRLVLRAPVVSPLLRALFQLARREVSPAPELPVASDAGPILGNSPAMAKLRERVARLAGSELPVLVLGETGTGKELVAREVHRLSRRAAAPFLPINCAAFSEGVLQSELFGHLRGAFTGADRDRAGIFETARGGTVFLDEIGDLPLLAQGNLLRLLQEGEVRRVGESVARKVDVRIVAATHRDLAAMVAAGSFREDLLYRLRGGTVLLPPLRDRGEDVLLLAGQVLRRLAAAGRVARLSPSARAALLAYPWPGNVRELVQVLETAAVLADGTIDPEHLELPETAAASARPVPCGDYHAQVESYRRRLVEEALAGADGNLAEAARQLGLTRQALSYLAKQFGILARRR